MGHGEMVLRGPHPMDVSQDRSGMVRMEVTPTLVSLKGHTSVSHDLELGRGRMEIKVSKLGVTLKLRDGLASGGQ